MSRRLNLNAKSKVCPRCRKTLPKTSEHFHSNKANADGLNSTCRLCALAYQKAKRESRTVNLDGERTFYRLYHRGLFRGFRLHVKPKGCKPVVYYRDASDDQWSKDPVPCDDWEKVAPPASFVGAESRR